MAKVVVVKTARPRVYTVSAGWGGDRLRQPCHRILNFALDRCIQKVTVLLLCSRHPHLNLIMTALCKIWDSERLVWRTEFASCSSSRLASVSGLGETTIIHTGTDHSGNFVDHLIPFICLSAHPILLVWTPVVCLYPPERKGIMNYCKGWDCKQLSVWNQSLIYWLSMLSHIRKLVAAVEDSPVVQKIYILFTANIKHYADHIKETNKVQVCVVTVMGWNEVWGWKWFVQ